MSTDMDQGYEFFRMQLPVPRLKPIVGHLILRNSSNVP